MALVSLPVYAQQPCAAELDPIPLWGATWGQNLQYQPDDRATTREAVKDIVISKTLANLRAYGTTAIQLYPVQDDESVSVWDWSMVDQHGQVRSSDILMNGQMQLQYADQMISCQNGYIFSPKQHWSDDLQLSQHELSRMFHRRQTRQELRLLKRRCLRG